MVREVKVQSGTSDTRSSPSRSKASSSSLRELTDDKRVSKPKSYTESAPRKSGRTRSPGRSRSSGRTKSPARPKSPGRKKSPARPKKTSQDSPKSKVAQKTTTQDNKSTVSKPVSITKIDLEFSASDDEYILPKEKPKATVRGRSRKLDADELVLSQEKDSIDLYSTGLRRITRSTHSQEERVVHLKNFDLTRKIGEFSDDDERQIDETKTKKPKIQILESLGIIFQIIFCPAFVIGFFVFCNESTCSFTSLPDFARFKSISIFFDLRSLLGFSLLFIYVALLKAIPFGGKKVCSLPSKQGKFVHTCNGVFCQFLIVSTWIAVEYTTKFCIAKFVVENCLHLAISAVIIGTTFSFYLYLRSFYVALSALNPSQVDKSGLSGFFHGKEINPRLFNFLDLKMLTATFSSILMIILDVSYLLNSLNLNGKLQSTIVTLDWKVLTIHPTLLVLVAFHILYVLYYTIFENRMLSSYHYQYEGIGYKIVLEYILYPFLFVTQTKYVAEHKVNLPYWALAALSIFYICGYAIFIWSNQEKDQFRRNPYSTASTKMDSLSTSQGKKLLCSGWWGRVRQPNILGDILVHIPLIFFVYNTPLVVGVLGLILALVERCVALQNDCKKKYGSSWEKYCQRVPYVLVPKVY